jgi:hypothetical protein
MKIMIISIVFAVFTVSISDASILDLLFKKNKQIKIVDLRQENTKPLTWLTGNIIVISKEASIYLYDIKRETLLERVVDSYDESNYQFRNCFSPYASVITLKPPIKEYKNGKINSNAIHVVQNSYRYIVDWQQPSKNKNVDFTIFWGTNELDCTMVDYKGRREYTNRREAEDGFYSTRPFSSPPLFRSIHGESFLFLKKRSNNKYPKHIEVGSKYENTLDTSKDTYMELELDTNGMPHGNEMFPNKIESFYDSHEDNYVLYENTDQFDSKEGVWPLTAWRVTPKRKLIERYTLPPGPWVKKHSFLKELSCFSRGCEGYSYMKLYGGGGKIYVHIWGKAVDSDEAGIYLLEGKGANTRWSSLILGNIKNNIIVSPDGCVIVFSDKKNNLKKMEICSSDK